jgi:hypothetical protein
MTTSEATQTKACQSCVYWDAQAGTEKGLCRRNAPQSIVFEVDDETQFVTRFPETAAEEWCGEYTGK